ncbi:MAG: hypothetical protein GY941_23980 [Planctomycetes bacterium]|nr:hypothetical protein [Planctomycetota bacterium]
MEEQIKPQAVSNEKLYSTSEVLRIFSIAKHKLDYLFESRRLRREDFQTLQNGHRIYREADLNKIREALYEVSK